MNDTNPETTPKPAPSPTPSVPVDVGAVLKSARLAKGFSFEIVGQQTRIPKKYLEALEANRWDEFPARVYLRGFLQNYCEHMGLDFSPLWKTLQPEPPAPAQEEAPETLAVPENNREMSFASKGSIALAVLLVFVLIFRARHSGKPGAELSRPATPAALEPLNMAESKLAITFQEESWISVAADGAILFEGKVPKHAREEWSARKNIVLRTPHPESLELTFNGAAYSLPRPETGGEYKIELQ